MKILIICDSLYGNTWKIAEAIKEGFGKNNVKLVKAIDAKPEDINGIEMLIVGSPTHGGWPSEKAKKFMDSITADGLKGIKAAAFDTSMTKEGQNVFLKGIIGFFGAAAKRTASILEKKGAEIIASETFYVLGKEGPLKKGETDRAKTWANKIIVGK